MEGFPWNEHFSTLINTVLRDILDTIYLLVSGMSSSNLVNKLLYHQFGFAFYGDTVFFHDIYLCIKDFFEFCNFLF